MPAYKSLLVYLVKLKYSAVSENAAERRAQVKAFSYLAG